MMIPFDTLRNLSIVEYLQYRNHRFTDEYGYKRTSSPFSRDSTPSFVVYDNNRYVCYSTGKRGDIIELVKEMESVDFMGAIGILGDYMIKTGVSPVVHQEKTKKVYKTGKDFDVNKYITNVPEEIELIKEYALSRGISSGYLPGVTFNTGGQYGEWERVPAMLFPHKDESLKITGAKFRNLHGEPRFTARGNLNWYVLSNLVETHRAPTLFIMESETSANSLWEYCKKLNKPAVILSFGGVSAGLPIIPQPYHHIKDRRVIIDYDGNEESFNMRMKRWEDFGTPLKMMLEKGEDINSLWVDNRIDLIYEFIK